MKKGWQSLVAKYFQRKGLPLDLALAFPDVIVRDKYSTINSRSDVRNLRSNLAGDVFLNIPIVSANMDSVTDSKMAIALARLGALGFIHQFLSLEERVLEVERVKRADNAFIEKPATLVLQEDATTLAKAKGAMRNFGVSSLLLIDSENVLLGILTARDYRFRSDDTLVKDLMQYMPLFTGSPGMTREQATEQFSKYRLEKLPIVDRNGKLKGLMTARDVLKEQEFPDAVRDKKGRLLVGATIRLNSDYLQEARTLWAAGADVILLDTARANSRRVRDAVVAIKKKLPKVPLVVGNIDTPEAAWMLIKAGADCLKVGIGPGSACKTREATGVGIPQLTAIASCAAVARKFNVPVIADGGIRCGADLAKALVAGANVVMLGSMLAGTDESPGKRTYDGGKAFKIYRGSASAAHQFDRIDKGSLDKIRSPEGVTRQVPYAGPVTELIAELVGDLRSSLSYIGARDLENYWRRGIFVRQSTAGYEEGKPKS